MLRTKGKREIFLCGQLGGRAGRVRAMRLDRHESDANAAWSELAKGDVLSVTPPFDVERPRVLADTRITPVAEQLDRDDAQTRD